MWATRKQHQEIVQISTKTNEVTINTYNIARHVKAIQLLSIQRVAYNLPFST
jgi:hypothetical protein